MNLVLFFFRKDMMFKRLFVQSSNVVVVEDDDDGMNNHDYGTWYVLSIRYNGGGDGFQGWGFLVTKTQK